MKAHNCYSYMSNNLNNPRDYDAVLGGQSPAPSHAAVLGGIEGVKLRLSSQVIEHRMSALSKALKYGEGGLKLVLQALDDNCEEIHKYAYKLLKSKNELEIKAAFDKYLQQSYSLRFDGLYCGSIPANSSLRLFRFYQDGTVLIPPVLSRELNLNKWIAKYWLNHYDGNHFCRGNYIIDGYGLNISLASTYDGRDYWGDIGKYGNTISLRKRIYNQDYKYSKTYHFVHVPNID